MHQEGADFEWAEDHLVKEGSEEMEERDSHQESLTDLILNLRIKEGELDEEDLEEFADNRVVPMLRDSFREMDYEKQVLLCAMDKTLTKKDVDRLLGAGETLHGFHDAVNNITQLYELTEDNKYEDRLLH